MKSYKRNEDVQWKWLGRFIEGQVKEVYFEPTVQVIKSKSIKRNGSKENPAYLVQSKAGNIALKLHSELQPKSQQRNSRLPKPSLFGGDD